MVVADPYLGFRYRPNFTGHLRRGDLDFAFTTDEKGFRNDSPSPKAADIVVVGDSMAFGYSVPDEATWSHRVATQLDGYTIRNFGLIGGAPQQYLRVLKSEALELNPKLVLFMLFPGNDLDDARVFKDWLEAHTDITYPERRIAGGAPPSPGALCRACRMEATWWPSSTRFGLRCWRGLARPSRSATASSYSLRQRCTTAMRGWPTPRIRFSSC